MPYRNLIKVLLAVDVILKLVAELCHESDDRHRCRVAKRAEGASKHVLGQILNVVDIFDLAAAGVDAANRLFEPVCALAAGDAPTAALVLIELDRPQRKLDHAHRLVENDDAARAEHRTSLTQLIEVQPDVDLISLENR